MIERPKLLRIALDDEDDEGAAEEEGTILLCKGRKSLSGKFPANASIFGLTIFIAPGSGVTPRVDDGAIFVSI